MKFNKKQKLFIYVVSFLFCLLFSYPIYNSIKTFNSLDYETKGKIIVIFIISILFILIITYLNFYLKMIVETYPNISIIKKNIEDNFKILYSIFSNKGVLYFLYSLSIFIIWNFSLYLENFENSMIIIIFLFIPNLLEKKEKKKLLKKILKAFLIGCFIYIISNFTKNEPIIKLSLKENLTILDYPAIKIILSFLKAILYMDFYIQLENIIRYICKNLIDNDINSRQKKKK